MIKKLLVLAMLFMPVATMAGSLANEVLLRDTINGIGGVKMVLSATGHMCHPQLIDAQVLQEPTDLKFNQGIPVSGYWRELWTLSCNQEKVIIPIKFVLDKTGASWIINVSEVKFK